MRRATQYLAPIERVNHHEEGAWEPVPLLFVGMDAPIDTASSEGGTEGLQKWARQMAAELQRLQDELDALRDGPLSGPRPAPADADIESIPVEFERRLGRVVIDAQRRAAALIEQAERDAEAVRSQARSDADVVLIEARRQASLLLEAARSSVAELQKISRGRSTALALPADRSGADPVVSGPGI